MEKEYPEIKKLNYKEFKKSYAHEKEICQVTLPQALYCFLISNSFEDCWKTTISIDVDCDTTSAILCAILEACYKDILNELVEAVNNKLTKEMLEIIYKIK